MAANAEVRTRGRFIQLLVDGSIGSGHNDVSYEAEAEYSNSGASTQTEARPSCSTDSNDRTGNPAQRVPVAIAASGSTASRSRVSQRACQ